MTHQLSQPDIGMIDKSRTSSVGNAQSGISDAKWLEYKSDANMGTKLLANGYTAKQIASMTTNDKIYAVSLLA